MIKIEHLVTASNEQMEFIIEGMRNPMDSWKKSDSNGLEIGTNDYQLMQKLAKAGTDHRKFLRMMPVYVRITAPLYFYKELDTYKVGTVSNSCSTMHKITAKEFDVDDFSTEHLFPAEMTLLEYTISDLNFWREAYFKGNSDEKKKEIWWQLIQLLPSSYNQTRNVMMNYEVLANIYKSRKNHKLDEWVNFCKWIEDCVPFSELITGVK